METAKKVKLWEPILIFVLAFLFILWGINAVNTGNVLWFSPIQPTYQPSRIVVRNYGQTENIQPGMPGYQELMQGSNDTFSAGFSNTDLINLGISDETLRRYHEEELVIEFYYAEDISYNSPIRMINVRQLLIPVDATHGGKGYVFLGNNGEWRAGALVLQNDRPLLTALEKLGYLQEDSP